MKNLSTQISFQPSMNEPHNGGRESRMCGGPVKVTTGTLRRQTVSPRQPPPQSTHHPSLTRLHPPPPRHTHTPTRNKMCWPQQILPARPLLSSPLLFPWEPVCPAATPGRRSIATILIALLSPGIVAAQCVKLTVSLSARFHTVARGTAERSTATATATHTHTHTNTHSLQTHLRLHSADRLVNRHL